MKKSATARSQGEQTTQRKSKAAFNVTRQKTLFPETKRSRKESQKYFKNAYPKVVGRPVNQRFRDLQTSDSFGPDPVRPLKSHAKLARDEEMIEQEVNALERILWVNLCSIARRTNEPQRLIWPLILGLSFIVNEFFDATSEYEMGTLDEALELLEFSTEGKILFARSND